MAIEIEVSAARCIASKTCTHAAEGVFEVVGGTARVVDTNAAPLDDVLAAAENCPTGAITVHQIGDGDQRA
ncbi:MAG: ferredoxin [Actinomycetota bacterium]|nr:ferredoxin [Actinomycetota bacterium]